jgi:hypothetical protein
MSFPAVLLQRGRPSRVVLLCALSFLVVTLGPTLPRDSSMRRMDARPGPVPTDAAIPTPTLPFPRFSPMARIGSQA